MACSTIQNLITELKDNNLAEETANGLVVSKPAQAVITLAKRIDAITSKIPALKERLTEPVYNLVGDQIIFNQDMVNLIDVATDMVNSANTTFWENPGETPVDRAFDDSSWHEIINNKKLEVRELTHEIAGVNFLIQQSKDPVKIKELHNMLMALTKRKIEIQDSLREIAQDPTVSKMLFMAKKDFDHIDRLLELNDPSLREVSEIEDLLIFYKSLSTIENNLVFTGRSFVDEEGNLTEEGEQLYNDVLVPIGKRAEELLSKIEAMKKDVAMQIIKSNPSMQNFFKDEIPDFNSLFFVKDGLMDATLLDAWLMDTTNGILSHNGAIPQIMNLEMQEEQAKNYRHVINLQADYNRVLKPAEEALSSMNGSIPGIPNGSWAVFLAHSRSGLRKEGIIQYYTSEYKEIVDKLRRKYEYRISREEREQSSTPLEQRLSRVKKEYLEELNKHSSILVFQALPELRSDSSITLDFSSYTDEKAEAYKASLIALMGEYAYSSLVEQAKKKLILYQNHRDDLLRNLLEKEGVLDEDSLSQEGKNELMQFFNESLTNQSVNEYYSIRIPRSKNSETGENYGYYNEVFKKLTSNKDLLEFYKVLAKNQNIIYNMLPPDKQKELGELSLLSAERTFWDLLSDKNLNLMEKVFEIIKNLKQFLIEAFTEKFKRPSVIKIDPITGKPIYSVNDSWIQTNSPKISSLTESYLIKLFPDSDNLALLVRASKKKAYSAGDMNSFVNILSELLGTAPTRSAVESRLGYDMLSRPLYDVIRDAATDRIMSEQSIDLPKILHQQLAQAVMYKARVDAMPRIELLKRYYEEIKDKDGAQRVNAMTQMESWFNRVVLDVHEANADLKSVSDSGYKVMTKADKLRDQELSVLENTLTANLKVAKSDLDKKSLSSMLQRVQNERSSLGRQFTLSSIGTGIVNLVRFNALGFNLNSSVTNFFEGQMSNALAADRGIYFSSESLVRANRIMGGTIVDTAFRGKVSPGGAKLAKFLMDKFDVQMDATNIFQESLDNSAIGSASKLGPWEFTRRVEFLNQSPVMISILLETEVRDEDGNVSNVWDAFDQETLELKQEFKTAENIAFLEDFSARESYALKSKISKAIMDIHGDYTSSHGNKISEYFTGKAIFSLKRWMIRKFYNLFGVEQYDIELGKKVKGTMRSMTPAQISLFAGIGGLILGPMWGVVLGAGGLGVGLILGLKTNMSILNDYIATLKNLAYQMVRMPAFFGTIHMENKLYDYGDDVREIDKNNMKSIFAMMSFALFFIGVGLIAKSLTAHWDEDEEDGVTTYLANKAFQFSSQAASWLNPIGIWKDLTSEMSILSWAENVGKFAKEVEKYIDGNKETKIWDRFSKIAMPSIIRPYLGFGGTASRDFYPTGWDDYIKSDEEKYGEYIKIAKQSELDKIRGNLTNISEEEWESIKRKVGQKWRKKPKETRKQQYDRLESKGVFND